MKTNQSGAGRANPSINQLAVDLEDCAGHLECHARWQAALSDAIYKMTHTLVLEAKPLDTGDRITVAQLASIGDYLTENAYAVACDYKEKAKAIRNGGAQ